MSKLKACYKCIFYCNSAYDCEHPNNPNLEEKINPLTGTIYLQIIDTRSKNYDKWNSEGKCKYYKQLSRLQIFLSNIERWMLGSEECSYII